MTSSGLGGDADDGVWELAEALFIAVRFLKQAPIDGQNKSLYHYVREVGWSLGRTTKCPGTFCSVTASSVTTPTLPHQPPTLQPSPLSIPHTNNTIPMLAFYSLSIYPTPWDPPCVLHRQSEVIK